MFFPARTLFHLTESHLIGVVIIRGVLQMGDFLRVRAVIKQVTDIEHGHCPAYKKPLFLRKMFTLDS